jgi:prepilin-type N-terminal cleavage/methylation domain-containing protein
MQRSPSQHHAFTLIEMITVIAIIAILSGLVLTIAGSVQRKGYQTRAETDVRTMAAGCEAYKTDNGGYPQDNQESGASVTNDIDPRVDTSPSSAKYAVSSQYLYKQLSGDLNANGRVEGTEVNRKYISDFFKPSRFDTAYKTTGNVTYIMDPFGNSYGYSTAGLKAEQDYRVLLETAPNSNRPATTKGYNPTFDLWTTAGATGSTDADRAKWIKNW